MTDAAPEHQPYGRRMRGLPALVAFAALVVLAVAVLLPIGLTALNGFKQLGELQAHPFGLPRVWMWSNYWDILTSLRYWQVLGNSLLIAGLTVFLTLAVSSMAAFTFAHLRFFGDRFLLSYMMLGLLFPVATAILPLFIKIRDLGLLNSYWGIVLPQVAFSLAMSILLLRVAFKQLPTELLDAAMMDGCGYFRYFFFITLPLSGPVLSTVAIISFVEAGTAICCLSSCSTANRAIHGRSGLWPIRASITTSWQLVLAFIILTILPAILIFLLAQRYIVAGLTAAP